MRKCTGNNNKKILRECNEKWQTHENSAKTLVIYISRILWKRPPFAPVISLPFLTHTSPRHPFVLRTIIIAWKLNDVPLLKRPSMKTFLCGNVYHPEHFPAEIFICGDVSHAKMSCIEKIFFGSNSSFF